MAGEAVLQLLKKSDSRGAGYTVRDVHFSNAMLLRDGTDTEIITTLRPQWLTAKLDSKWYEFTIMSHNGVSWTRHCRGLVTDGIAGETVEPVLNTFTRKISPDRWYKAMAQVGLKYGPRFQGLHEITTSVTNKIASFTVTDRQEDWESSYGMHPATLDAIFQSWSVAKTNGVYRQFTRLSMPTFIEELYVGCAALTTIRLNTSGDQRASSYGVVDGAVVLSLRGLEATQLESGDKTEFEVQHLQWMLDFDFADPAKLMKSSYSAVTQLALVERLYVLCAVGIQKRLKVVTPSQPHFSYFQTWLDKQVERFGEPNYPLVEDSANLLELETEAREEMIGDCLDRIQRLDTLPLGMAVWKTYKHLPDIIAGRTNFLDLLLEDGLLQRIYDWMNDLQDVTDLFRILGNTRPQLKVLEIGAGTGGLTSKVLSSLRSDYGERLYLTYTFTDISSGFFVKAQTRFEDYDSIEYKVLDIAQDPVRQGFREGEFDVIVASNVLHATPSLAQTLQNCRKLLQPDGYIFMQELSPTTKSANFVMGLFSGWWLGRDDGRLDEPYVSPEVWDAKLRDAGFDGISAIMLGEENSHHFNANILARPTIESILPTRVTLLVGPEGLGLIAQATQKVFEHEGYEVDVCIWGKHTPRPDQDVLSFVDVEGSTKPLLSYIQEGDLSRLLQLIDNLAQANLLWLTKPAQINCSDPYNAQILGLARTARLELGLRFATMELEDAEDNAALAIVGVLQKLQRATHADRHVGEDMEEDMEYAWKAGFVHISRFHWLLVDKALANENAVPEAKRLAVSEVGMLHSLQWRGQSFEDLGTEQVRVRTSTIGMNFKEILHALGVLRVDTIDGRTGGINASGFEGAGRVIAVGSGVQNVQVGDRVMWASTGLPGFATEVQMPSDWCVKIPQRLSDEEAATMPVVYYTVLSCLVDKANLQRGQSLLIHSAAGGVGIAALHVARWLGADIYVTVGTDEKVRFLMREFGMPRERIFCSRDDSFAHDIMRATNKVGVDVILNSLSGELLHASWKCLAAGGCMVEIGQRDVVGHGQLAMSPFAANRTFTCVDASKLLSNLPNTQRKLQQVVELYEHSHIHPIRPRTLFNAANVEDAFRHMQQGQHIGKLVVKFPEQDDVLPLTRTVPKASFRADASYLLVGGTGGLGKAVASWMMSCGASNLIFLSRSAGQSTADQDFFDELREGGCQVQCYVGDVVNAQLIHTIVQQARQPISGVIQMAMVLRDVALMDMDAATWAAAVQPKIDGTWNLHRILPANMDFFVLFSSMAGLFGHFGQANYASANAFLDAFVHYRQAHGLVASVLDLGPIEDVGYVAHLSQTHHSVATYADTISEQDFLDALHLAMVPQANRLCNQYTYENPSQLALVPRCALSIADPRNNAIWVRDPRMAIYRNIEKLSAASRDIDASDTVRSFIASLPAEPGKLEDVEAPKLLARAVGARVATFLMMNDVEDVDMSQTLAAMGVDSLVSIELRNWWKQAFGVDVSVLELMNGGSIDQLGDLAVDRLKKKYSTKDTMARA